MKASAYLIISLLLSLTSSAEQWWKINGTPEVGDFRGGHQPEGFDAELEQFFSQTKFKEWTTYEDDLVKIQYPKHPLLTFAKKENNAAGITVEGGVCTTVDNSFQNAYYLKAGDTTYGVFLVQAADWLDDGICLCGPMVHHVYNIENGCLVRFSLLPGGAVKKAQVLSDKLRLMSFEWTHLSCPKDVYEQMVERMELKMKSTRTADDFKKELTKRYGLSGTAGMLQSGMKLEEAIKLLGKPVESSGTEVIWHGVTGDYETKVIANLSDGKISHLKDDSITKLTGKAIEGSFTWAVSLISDENEGLGAGQKVSEEQKSRIFNIFLKTINDGHPQSWLANHAILTLAKSYNYTDPKVITLFTLNKAEYSSASIEILKKYVEAKIISVEQQNQWYNDTIDHLNNLDAYAIPYNIYQFGHEGVQDFLVEVIEASSDSDEKLGLALLNKVIKHDNPSWYYPLLDSLVHDLDEQTKFSLTIKALKRGVQLKNNHIIEAGIKSLENLELNAKQQAAANKAMSDIPEEVKNSMLKDRLPPPPKF